MFRCLSPGAIGINSSLEEGLQLARQSGFTGLEVSINGVATRARSSSSAAVRDLFDQAGIKPGGWGLPMNLLAEESEYQKALKQLPQLAEVAREIGANRCFTWILPFSDERAYADNFEFHRQRISPVAAILAQEDCCLGLEFIGPATLRAGHTYPFIYQMNPMLELCAACGQNVGLLLDCWHWYTSGGTIDEILALKAKQIVYVHVNDAPAGISVDQQIDNVRDLPGQTGVIDLVGFLQALNTVGYEGPVVPEPFCKQLESLTPVDAATRVGSALSRVWQASGLN